MDIKGYLGAGGNFIYTDLPTLYYKTNDIQKGELVIKKLDEVNQIISGTFWFDALDENGEIVQVREGRFDMKYVK